MLRVPVFTGIPEQSVVSRSSTRIRVTSNISFLLPLYILTSDTLILAYPTPIDRLLLQCRCYINSPRLSRNFDSNNVHSNILYINRVLPCYSGEYSSISRPITIPHSRQHLAEQVLVERFARTSQSTFLFRWSVRLPIFPFPSVPELWFPNTLIVTSTASCWMSPLNEETRAA